MRAERMDVVLLALPFVAWTFVTGASACGPKFDATAYLEAQISCVEHASSRADADACREQVRQNAGFPPRVDAGGPASSSSASSASSSSARDAGTEGGRDGAS